MGSFIYIALFCFVTASLLPSPEGKEFVVGGNENSWEIPSSPDDFNKWAAKKCFKIGDCLVLKYDPESDSVLQVCEEDYINCNTDRPIKEYNEAHTKIKLDKSGPFYFISGAKGHCERGQKLEVKVLAAKHGHSAPAPAPSDATRRVQDNVGLVAGAFVCVIMAALIAF